MDALKVELGTIEIGTLEVFPDFAHRFTFADSYSSLLLGDRPVLGQLFEDRFPHAIDVDGPMCWFSHLLPQGAMRKWRSRLLGIEEDDDFALLSDLGGNLPGAVILSPTRSELEKPNEKPLPGRTRPDTTSLLKFSLAGAQWKLSAKSSGRGLTTKAEGGGCPYIAKFDAPEYPGLPECEFATMSWAKATGIAVPEFQLRNVDDFDAIPEEMPIGNRSVYTIERFDRTKSARIHMEDFGQILDRPPGIAQYRGGYEDIARVISWIAPDDTIDFLKQLVFTIICGNGDAHLKNFSAIYPGGRNARLSPAYDIVSTICYDPPNREKLALTLDSSQVFSEVRMRSFHSLCDALQLDFAEGKSHVKDTVGLAVEAWHTEEIRGAYSSRHRDRIEQHLGSLQFP